MEPTPVLLRQSTRVVVVGRNFHQAAKLSLNTSTSAVPRGHWQVRIDGLALTAESVQWLNTRSLSVLLPDHLSPGPHALTVVSPNGLRHHLDNALQIASPATLADAGTPFPPEVQAPPERPSPVASSVDASAPLERSDASSPAARCDAPTFGTPQRVDIVGYTLPLFGPAPSNDGSTLFFSGRFDSGREDIRWAVRSDRGVQYTGLSSATSWNSTEDDGTPHLAADELSLYFYSTRPGGLGGRDIWTSSRPSTESTTFASPTVVAELNSFASDQAPHLSTDQLTILFNSTRIGYGHDLFRAQRTSLADRFSAPAPVSELNSVFDDVNPSLSSDGLTVYFASNRLGSLSIWSATRFDQDSNFASPTFVDALSSVADDYDVALTPDGLEIFFVSDRSGTASIYRAMLSCP